MIAAPIGGYVSTRSDQVGADHNPYIGCLRPEVAHLRTSALAATRYRSVTGGSRNDDRRVAGAGILLLSLCVEPAVCSIPPRILGGVDEYMFNSGELRLALEAQTKKMAAAIDAESEESLKQADIDAWAAALAHHFGVACPELKANAVWMEPPAETGVDVSRDPMRMIIDPYSDTVRNYPGYRVIVHVPFHGEADVFKLRPSSFTLKPPRGRIESSELVLTLDYPHDHLLDIDATLDSFITSVSQSLTSARADIGSFNGNLERQARQAIELRRQRIEQRDAHLARSKVPVRRPGESGKKTYIPNVLVRRPAPSLPETRADDKPPQLEPVLDERVFEHILDVIRMHAQQMEQSPRTYAGMGEEDRRQTVVAVLNTHYAGRAHAEAFNNEGKTDILIRYEGRNLFICECNFWSGAEGFRKTIDQLFHYTGWRDTKLAIVMFVREKALTSILKKARQALTEYETFVSWKEAANETELRATVHWPGDEDRFADLNVFFVHTPQQRT